MDLTTNLPVMMNYLEMLFLLCSSWELATASKENDLQVEYYAVRQLTPALSFVLLMSFCLVAALLMCS